MPGSSPLRCGLPAGGNTRIPSAAVAGGDPSVRAGLPYADQLPVPSNSGVPARSEDALGQFEFVQESRCDNSAIFTLRGDQQTLIETTRAAMSLGKEEQLDAEGELALDDNGQPMSYWPALNAPM